MLVLNHYVLISLAFTYVHSENVTGTFRILNPKGPNHQTSVVDCLHQLLLRYFVPYRYMLTVVHVKNLPSPTYEIAQQILREINIHPRWFLEILETVDERENFESANVENNCSQDQSNKLLAKSNFMPKYKSKYVLIITDSYENFIKKLDHVVKSQSFDLRAKLLIYLSTTFSANGDIVTDVTEALRLRKIFKFLVVISKDNPPKLYAYCLNLYLKAEVCGQNPRSELMYTCDKGKLTTKKYIFDYGVPKDFHHCKIEAITVKYPFCHRQKPRIRNTAGQRAGGGYAN